MHINDILKNEILPDDIIEKIIKYKVMLDNQKANIIIKYWRKYNNYQYKLIDKIPLIDDKDNNLEFRIDSLIYDNIKILTKYLHVNFEEFFNFEYYYIKVSGAIYQYDKFVIDNYNKEKDQIHEITQKLLMIDTNKLKIVSIYLTDFAYKLLLLYNKYNKLFNSISVISKDFNDYKKHNNINNVFNSNYIDTIINKIKIIQNKLK